MTAVPSLPTTSTAEIPRTLQTVRDVRVRAAALAEPETEGERKAMRRLDHVLTSDEPLNTEVPRGYYLNIQV
ncbi:MAG: hypothetical protein EXQ86_00405 [Rhodospirillales bacterium]|nr:hypothetical protein [Rhodospirillales bacterium]